MKLPRASAVVSTVFGIGYFPQAQGTIMSAIAVPLAILLAIVGHGGMVVAGAAIIVLVVGILSCSDYVRETGNPDPSECVIDELAGQWLACSFVAFSPFQLAPFFLVFALFEGELLNPLGYGIDATLLMVVALLAFRVTRTRQMTTQYPWLYQRTGPLSWRERS